MLCVADREKNMQALVLHGQKVGEAVLLKAGVKLRKGARCVCTHCFVLLKQTSALDANCF